MEDLIRALTIFLKYGNNMYPTHCEHDVLNIVGIHIKDVLQEDIETLKGLGFFWSDSEDCFISYKYGSA